MNLDQAKRECERWFDYLKRQEETSLALQKLAADRRAGKCDREESRRRLAEIDGLGLTVYDGANLEKAVRVLFKECEK